MSVDVPTGGTAGGGDHLFVRQATGLVRELSLRDNVVLSASYISVFLGFTYLTLVPSTFTGANIALAFALTFALCVPHFVTYGWLSSAMPRSRRRLSLPQSGGASPGGFIVNGIHLAGVHPRASGTWRSRCRSSAFPCDVRVPGLPSRAATGRIHEHIGRDIQVQGQVWIAGALIVIHRGD